MQKEALIKGKSARVCNTTVVMADVTQPCDLQDFAEGLDSLERALLERFLAGTKSCASVSVSREIDLLSSALLPSLAMVPQEKQISSNFCLNLSRGVQNDSMRPSLIFFVRQNLLFAGVMRSLEP